MSAVEYSAQVKKAANFAIITALILIIAKGIAWWQTGSVSLSPIPCWIYWLRS